MASLPIPFLVGSSSSGRNVRDALESYRRSQYLVACSTSLSATGDIESPISENEEEPCDLYRNDTTPFVSRRRGNGPASDVDWDEDDLDDFQHIPHHYGSVQRLGQYPTPPLPISNGPPVREVTPLLRKAASFSVAENPKDPHLNGFVPQTLDSGIYPVASRRQSHSSLKAANVHYAYHGKSTFGQTLFNSIAILLGVGMLSEPLAFAYAGWIGGTILIISFGVISCYTAKILAHIILADPRLRSYADIGRKAFGPRSTLFISFMFCLELFAVSVILVTLYADSLHSILPQYSADVYKLWGLVILIPTVFLPLSLLSYTSVLGILSTVLIIGVVVVDGFSKKEGPGSLWSPAPTSMVPPEGFAKFGIAFGLFMAGFSGHVVIPSLARDMEDPSQFDRMINWAFIVATSIYALIGSAGYLMFGGSVSDEISEDLLKTPGYNTLLNQIALWLLVISPLSKFALTTQPLNATLEIMLGIDTPSTATSSHEPAKFGISKFASGIQSVAVTLLSVGVSIVVPDFSSAMAFLGSFSAFILCIVGPVLAKVTLARKCGLWDGFLLVLGFVMAIWGTVAAIISV